jgi:hypothetical protein
MTFRRITSLCILLSVVALGWYFVRSDVGAPEVRPSVQPNPVAPALGSNHAASGFAAVQRVLPSVTAAVTDWSAWKPESITIAPEPGLELPFHVVRVTEENGVTTWVGRNGLKGASLVGIGKRDRWDGVLSMIGGSFDVHVYGDTVRVVEHSGAFECAPPVTPLSKVDTKHQALLATVDNSIQPMALAHDVAGNASVHTSGTTIYTVEVVFFHTVEVEQDPDAIAEAGGTSQVHSYLDSKYRGYLETGNLIAEQSGVANLRWHFAGLFKAPSYTRTVSGVSGSHTLYEIGHDLGAMLEPTPFGQFVRDTSAAVAADQWMLIATWTSVGGIASAPGNDSVVSNTDPVTAVLHELGHNFGLSHDRITDNASDGNGRYDYGYQFRYNPKNFGGSDYDYTFGDLMSYGGPLPYFSNPHISFTGNELGAGSVTDTNRYVLGVDVDQPKAAYGARYLSEHVAELAAYRSTPGQVFPAIAAQPPSTTTVGAGASVHLSVTATGTNLTYQWRKNAAAIAGATGTSLDVGNLTAADQANYDCVVTNALGSAITGATSVYVSSGPIASRLVDISTRSPVATGDAVQIAGFVISGTIPKTVLIRASGPTLAALGVQGALVDPTIELHGPTGTIGFNDNWSTDTLIAEQIRTAAAQIGAYPWATGSKDAALLVTLNPGVYSAIVAGKSGGSGVALVEVYEISGGPSAMANISTRSQVGTGDAVQIAGFVVTGTSPKTLLIRAAGPTLAALGVQGALIDPTIELHNTSAAIAFNDDWSSDAAKADAIRAAGLTVGAYGWATGSKDAALLVTLNPGVYSAIVAGKSGGSGVALVEVYDVTP